MVDTSKWVYVCKNKVKPSNVDSIINKLNSAIEDLRKLRDFHDSVIANQQLVIDTANNTIKQSSEEKTRAEAAMQKIKELSQL